MQNVIVLLIVSQPPDVTMHVCSNHVSEQEESGLPVMGEKDNPGERNERDRKSELGHWG